MFKANTSHINMRLSFLLMAFLLLPVSASAINVLIETPLGEIELEMLEDDAPNTVANFLKYVNGGNYEDTFIHRVELDFVMQGGGWTFENDIGARQVSTSGSVANEFKVSNTRGTVAMAKFENQPDSATSQWFINLDDNSDNLDNQNGGFTVFAKVVRGMEVADAINDLNLINGGPSFPSLPVIDFTVGDTIVTDNLVMTKLTELDRPFLMNAGLNDAWYEPATSGQGFFITVYPTLNKVVASWFTFDTELAPADATGDLVGSGQRWLQAQGLINDNTSDMIIYSTTGGLFDDENSTVNTAENGTMKLTFDDCSTGTVEYNIPSINRQGSIPIQRVAGDNIALCEELYGVAD